MKKEYGIILIIISLMLVSAFFIFMIEGNAIEEKYCSAFMFSECPNDRCELGPSCAMCTDIVCHPKGYNSVLGSNTSPEPDKLACASDADCACGSWKTGNCAVGNKDYIDVSVQCPDFCTGIAGNLKTACVNSVCKIIQKSQTECVKEGESLGPVIPDNTKECCEGLVSYVPQNILGTRGTCQKPGYGEKESGCTSDSDCVPKECCHPATCVNKDFKGVCNMMCTMNCQAGTLDCGQGGCKCVNGACTAVYNNEESYCSQFNHIDCPKDRCEIGPSCNMCEDIGCHAKGYSDNWNQ